VSVTDPLDATTVFTFDGAGNMAALADPLGNETTWSYDHAGRVVEEENELEDSRTFAYTADDRLASKTDRNGRVVEYDYDLFGRRTAETWKDGQSTVREFSFAYNRQGELLSASDPAAEYTFDYDALGRVTSVTQEIDGLTPTVVMEHEYDVLGRRAVLATTLGSSDDFRNTYAFDDLARLARIDQAEVSGGNAVAPKRIDFSHDDADQFASITRYNNASGTQLVAGSAFTFDNTGRLIALTHSKGQTTLADYDWTFDAASRMTQHVHDGDGTADYTSDDASQLTAADYDYDPPLDDEAYTYDDNGNRVTGGYTVGTCNRMTSDGTYAYLYDDEGNRTARFIDADEDGVITSGDTDITTYAWDHRNRLVEVSHFADYGDYNSESPDKVVQYAYDYQNRWVRKLLDSDGDGDTDSSTILLYDAAEGSPLPQAGEGPGVRAGQILFQFDKSGTGDASASDLAHRYLWGPSVDQLLADEQVTSLETAGTILWPLGDHLNTLRDLATYDDQTDTTTICNHRVFDAFGVLRSQTNSSAACLFAFTARPLDPDTLLQNNLHRWYDPTPGRWLSEDPIASDLNLYRYVVNNPIPNVDPRGEKCTPAGQPFPTMDWVVVAKVLEVAGGSEKCVLAAKIDCMAWRNFKQKMKCTDESGKTVYKWVTGQKFKGGDFTVPPPIILVKNVKGVNTFKDNKEKKNAVFFCYGALNLGQVFPTA